MNRSLYAMHDVNPADKGAFPITADKAEHLQRMGYGIFWTVNEFRGPRRIENLVRINSWAIEMDSGSKEEQQDRLAVAPIVPSLVVETKRGYHVYYNAKNATPEKFEAIVKDRLCYWFNADIKARDLARILRAPNFLHQKDPNDPFLCKVVWETPVEYTEDQMFFNFPIDPVKGRELEQKAELRKCLSSNVAGDEFWDRVYSMDCEYALEKLSGTAAVSFDTFTFKRVAKGHLNIWVNGKGTSCFIDQQKRIGSMDGGGPSVWQWVNWYHRDHQKTFKFITETFPELNQGGKC